MTTTHSANSTTLLETFLTDVRSSTGERVVIEDLFAVIAVVSQRGDAVRGRMADADDATHIFTALQYCLHFRAIAEF